MAQSRRIKVQRERRDELGTDQLVLYWLQAKQVLRERREREAKARAKRQRRES
jgi:hypothetical protein